MIYQASIRLETTLEQKSFYIPSEETEEYFLSTEQQAKLKAQYNVETELLSKATFNQVSPMTSVFCSVYNENILDLKILEFQGTSHSNSSFRFYFPAKLISKVYFFDRKVTKDLHILLALQTGLIFRIVFTLPFENLHEKFITVYPAIPLPQHVTYC